MNCHLIELAKAGRLDAEQIKNQTALVERIHESDSFDIMISQCQKCGQLFAECFKQYTSPDFEDDYWTFWIPITQDEVASVRNGKPLLKFMGEFIHQRSHICWHPDGHVFWAEHGFPLAFIVFLP